MKKPHRYLGLLAVIVVLISLFMFLLFGGFDAIFGSGSSKGTPDAEKPSPTPQATPDKLVYTAPGLYINEVVTSNKYCLIAPDGSAPDWVEIYNATGSGVNLSGYGLTDDENSPYKFKFPNVMLDNGKHLLVLCTGQEDTSLSDGYLRAGFKLSSAGETISLFAPNDARVDQVTVPASEPDVSYGRTGEGEYLFFGQPTPGATNGGSTSTSPNFAEALEKSDIVINEFLADNRHSLLDADSDRPAWVEIKNTGSSTVNITGYGLSDDADNTKKWQFPEMELAPGEIRVVFLSGKDRRSGELHTSFSISSADTKLILSK